MYSSQEHQEFSVSAWPYSCGRQKYWEVEEHQKDRKTGRAQAHVYPSPVLWSSASIRFSSFWLLDHWCLHFQASLLLMQCVCVCARARTQTTYTHMQACHNTHVEVRGQLAGVSSYSTTSVLGDWTQAVRSDSECLYPLSNLAGLQSPCNSKTQIHFQKQMVEGSLLVSLAACNDDKQLLSV